MNTANRKSQAERRAQTRGAILDATIDCLIEVGYQKATIARIAKTAGVTTGAVQHHFESRQALMRAAISEQLFAPHPVDWAAHASKPLRRRCKLLVDDHWRFYANPRYMAIWDIILAARHDQELMASIAALVPKPRVNRTRFHGVFSPNSKLREFVVPRKSVDDVGVENQSGNKAYSMTWAQRLKRVLTGRRSA